MSDMIKKTTREGRQGIGPSALDFRTSFNAVRFSPGVMPAFHLNARNARRLAVLLLMVLEDEQAKGLVKIILHHDTVKVRNGLVRPNEVKRWRGTVIRDAPPHGETNDSAPPPEVRELPCKNGRPKRREK